MKLLRKIFFPIVPIYYLVTWLRNKCYDSGFFKSRSYTIPVVAIGNLSTGGTGKTPMAEYVIKLLKNSYKLAVLSRGYGRKTKGFVLADNNVTADSIGDEPFQFYNKFKEEAIIAVDENRQHGIEQLQQLKAPEVIVLDDAYQHRKVKAGFYILLTTYANLYIDDIVLPTGNLREPRSGANRADVVIVTKCPEGLSEKEKQDIEQKLRLEPHQKLFFSTINYTETIESKEGSSKLNDLNEKSFTLVTGIADPSLMMGYLKNKGLQFEHLNYKDHHIFSDKELSELEKKNFILTTEKDYMRLESKLKNKNLYYLPIETRLLTKSDEFDEVLLQYIENFKL